MALAMPALLPTGLDATVLSTPAAAAETIGGCDSLSVLTTAVAGAATSAVVAVPAVLSRTALPAAAFHAEQAGNPVAVSARRLTGRDLAVTVVLSSSAQTSDASFEVARDAAFELLLGLPDGARTSTVSVGQQGLAGPLSPVRARSTQALRLLRPGGGSGSAAAVQRAARGLPPGGHVVLISDGTSDGPASAQQAAVRELSDRRLVLDRIGYGGAQTRPAGLLAGHGCPSKSGGLLRQVDQVVAEVQGQYQVRLATRRSDAALLSVRFAGTTANTVLPASSANPTLAAPTPNAHAAEAAQPSTSGYRLLLLLAGVLNLMVLIALVRVFVRQRWRRGVPAGYSSKRPAELSSVPDPGVDLPTALAGQPDGRTDARVGRPALPAAAYVEVDVAIVMESTYPYLKGGVSAVVHDIVMGNQDLTFGIIHITWDSKAAQKDLYGMPANVKWVRPVYLSMSEHREGFVRLRPKMLRMRSSERLALSHRLFDALASVLVGDMDPMWALYDDGMNPRTRTFPLWALLGSKEFMAAARDRLPNLGLPLADMFWLLREFFSLACAVLGGDMPKARVYHAHTTGYASLLGASAARQNGTKFLLTEHNLYVRDTVNMLLQRSMALPVTARDWRESEVTPLERAWMAWWIEMGQACYPSAEVITYLYPTAITEAVDLGAPVEKSVVIPNGMIVRDFEGVYQQRLRGREQIQTGTARTWRLVYIARVVPIKGLADLITTIALLVERGITNFHLDILGPTDHHPDYYRMCREKAQMLNVEEYLTFRGTVAVRDLLGEFDLLVLPSYNEGQPIVVLEAMTAGIPIVGTNVGGMAQLISDPLTTPGGRTWEACGLLINPDYAVGMADGLQTMMRDTAMYEEFAGNACGRVANFFQLEDAMGAYNRLYRELGGLPIDEVDDSQDAARTPWKPGGTPVASPRTEIDLTAGVPAQNSPEKGQPGRAP